MLHAQFTDMGQHGRAAAPLYRLQTSPRITSNSLDCDKGRSTGRPRRKSWPSAETDPWRAPTLANRILDCSRIIHVHLRLLETMLTCTTTAGAPAGELVLAIATSVPNVRTGIDLELSVTTPPCRSEVWQHARWICRAPPAGGHPEAEQREGGAHDRGGGRQV